jgi:hypothetical protein
MDAAIDIERSEEIDKKLDRLIARRSEGRDKAIAEEELWKASVGPGLVPEAPCGARRQLRGLPARQEGWHR